MAFAMTSRTAVLRNNQTGHRHGPSAPRRSLPVAPRRIVVRATASEDSTPVVEEASITTSGAPVVNSAVAAAAPARPGFGEVMAFSGAPEIINGRLAMLAFVAALGAELSTGETVLSQLFDAPILVAVTAVVFSWASLVPWLKGDKEGYGLGPFTSAAELLNGRAAMLGFAALLIVEAIKHSALF